MENEEMMEFGNGGTFLQKYMKDVNYHSRSSEDTARLNQALSQKYAESLPEFLSKIAELVTEYKASDPNMKTIHAEHLAEPQALKCRDMKVRQKLINLNLRLVIAIVNDYPSAKIHQMDAISEGNIGLMKGVDRYDPSFGSSPSSYYYQWIKAYVIRFCVNNARLVKLGTTEAQRKLFFNLNKERERLNVLLNSSDIRVTRDGQTQVIQRELGEAAGHSVVTDELLAKRLKVATEEVTEMSQRAPDTHFQNEEEAGGLHQEDIETDLKLPDDLMEVLQNKSLRDELINEFRQSIPNNMTRKTGRRLYHEVFEQRFLRLGEDNCPTLEEIGREVGLTKARIQQIDSHLWAGDPKGELKCGNDPTKPFRGLVDFFRDEIGGPI